MTDFGLTNDESYLRAAIAFREAAIADGWKAEPTFKIEALESHATLTRDGFKMFVKARVSQPGAKWKFEAEVDIWGPDGLAIDPPFVYDSNYIASGTRRCGRCKRENVDTFRAGFANRCCVDCLPIVRKQIEVPGWTS